EMGQPIDDRLGSRPSNYFQTRRRTKNRTRRRFKRAKLLGLRQPRKTFHRRIDERISVRVDAGREIEPGFWRLRIGFSRGKKISAMPGNGQLRQLWHLWIRNLTHGFGRNLDTRGARCRL